MTDTTNPARPLRRLPTSGRQATVLSTEALVRMRPLRPEGKLPLLVEPALGGVSLREWAAGHRELLESRLREHGGLLFRGFDVDSPEAFNELIRAVAGEALEYRERSSPRSQVSGNIYTSTDYPAHQSIFLHNENSYQRTWPGKLFFFCALPAERGGETPIADVRRVLQRIDPGIRRRFDEKGVLYMRNFGQNVGLSWSTVFQTEDRREVEEYCRQAGIAAEWTEGGGLRTRTVRPAVRRHPRTGEEVWFNHATFFHISTFPPEIRQGLLQQFRQEDLPSNSFYGDGTPIEDEVMDELRRAYAAETISFPWQRGDVLLLDNMLVAHARAPFEGPRKILVGMSDPVRLDD